MTVAAVQHDIAWEDPAANRARLAPMVASAVERGARLVLFSEMWATGFSMAVDRVAEAPDGPSTAFLVEQAAAHGVWVGGSLPVRLAGADRPSNCFTLAAPDGSIHRYAKIHTFSHTGEDRHYASGSEHVTVDVAGCRCTLFVCYDLRFADEFWACAPTTDCYLVVANWPAVRGEHWRTLLRARAIENQAYVVGVNRVGHDPALVYDGDSAVVDPLGEVVVTATGEQSVLVADIDPKTVAETRETYRFMADRRPGR